MNAGFTFFAEEGGGDGDVQAAWEFRGAGDAVAAEHARRSTTSVDDKILRQRMQRPAARAPEPESSESDSEDEGEAYDEEAVAVSRVARAAAQVTGRERATGGARRPRAAAPAVELEDAVLGGSSKQRGRGAGKEEDDEGEEEDEDEEEEEDEEGALWTGGGARARSHTEATFRADSFAELHLSRPFLKACAALGYERPTPIQAAVVPLALTGRDVLGRAVTGSGKTAAFVLPLLERLLHRPRRVAATRGMILTPTRELAVQIEQMASKLGQFSDVRVALIVGGLSMHTQAATLRTRPEIVIATPGRMIDHLRNTHSVHLEDLAVLILDEADRLLELGFADEVRELVSACPSRRQTMLFSATLSKDVESLVQLSLRNPAILSADGFGQAPGTLSEEVVKVRSSLEGTKGALLMALCTRSLSKRTMVFFKTKHTAHKFKILFGLAGLAAAELHGNLTQAQRLAALEAFRTRQAEFLLATDVAARGLDIAGVETVISFDAPQSLATYLHRIGRTARAGATGRSVTLMEESDRALLKQVVKRSGRNAINMRTVSTQVTAQWKTKLEEMEEQIEAVLDEERAERVLRKTEMEAQKAINLVEHSAEIYSRPARTWFQTEKEKLATKKKAYEEAQGGTAAGGAKRKRDKSRDRGEGDGGPDKKKSRGDEASRGKVAAFKAIERARIQGGQNKRNALKATKEQLGVTERNSSKKKKASTGGLFSGDGAAERIKPKTATQRGHAFKSQRRYKRR
mmetsp:Transcript_17066/g.55809  ORF Transcript_17066/g.55809 Transcript_17066/m.55809 type:complete len:746 (-) Transcript_17066:63-2300(-)